jgi:Xaa-Pro aminopeptidase
MKLSRLDALLVTDIINVRYLTGFSGSNGVCIITSKKHVFITDRRYSVQASQEVKGFNIVIAKQDVFVSIAENKILSVNMRVGFESRNLSVDQLKSIRKVLHGINLVAEKGIFDTVTAVKDDDEVDLIKCAAHITDKVYGKILNIIRPGIHEFDISAEISYWHRKYGAECDAFDPIVASGIRSALPHARASGKNIERFRLQISGLS